MVWDLRSLCDKADYAIIRYAINRIRLYSVFVNNVVDKLNTALQMTGKLSPNNVDIAHFLPSAAKKNNKESPPKKTIMIKFV